MAVSGRESIQLSKIVESILAQQSLDSRPLFERWRPIKNQLDDTTVFTQGSIDRFPRRIITVPLDLDDGPSPTKPGRNEREIHTRKRGAQMI